MQTILSDHNCEGQAEAIFTVLRYQGYAALLSLNLLFFSDVELDISADDEEVWWLCQEKEYLLLTGNRSAADGSKSLEFTIRRLLHPNSLPVITIANLRRINADQAYCELCAEQLAEIILDLDKVRGVPRLYIPGHAVGR
ncbi:MAG: ACP S-malonyltransferase [Aquincola sp.]|nr:ACP S-malonyltransferase [Aquincola sp.]